MISNVLKWTQNVPNCSKWLKWAWGYTSNTGLFKLCRIFLIYMPQTIYLCTFFLQTWVFRNTEIDFHLFCNSEWKGKSHLLSYAKNESVNFCISKHFDSQLQNCLLGITQSSEFRKTLLVSGHSKVDGKNYIFWH